MRGCALRRARDDYRAAEIDVQNRPVGALAGAVVELFVSEAAGAAGNCAADGAFICRL